MKISVLFIVAALVCVSAYALLDNSGDSDAATDDSGDCGTDVHYDFNASTGVLTFSGSGEMNNYSSELVPWDSYMNSIKSVVVTGTVTTIANNAFYKCTSLTSVDLGSSITAIKSSAFYAVQI